MSWNAGADVSTGDLITAAVWNNYMGAAGSIEHIADTMELWVPCNLGTQAIQNTTYPYVPCTNVNDRACASFIAPQAFDAIVAAKFIVWPLVTDGAANWDLQATFAAVGEAYNTHVVGDATTTYNVANGVIFAVDLATVLAAMVAGDVVGGLFIELGDADDDFRGIGVYLEYSIG